MEREQRNNYFTQHFYQHISVRKEASETFLQNIFFLQYIDSTRCKVECANV